MLDDDKPRRSRAEEEEEILRHFKDASEQREFSLYRQWEPTLEDHVSLLKRREEEDRQAKYESETPEEREASDRLGREEEETLAEITFLRAQQERKRHAAFRRRPPAEEETRQAS